MWENLFPTYINVSLCKIIRLMNFKTLNVRKSFPKLDISVLRKIILVNELQNSKCIYFKKAWVLCWHLTYQIKMYQFFCKIITYITWSFITSVIKLCSVAFSSHFIIISDFVRDTCVCLLNCISSSLCDFKKFRMHICFSFCDHT